MIGFGLLAALPAFAQDFKGNYQDQTRAVSVTIQQVQGQQVSGILSVNGQTHRIDGETDGQSIVGVIEGGQGGFVFMLAPQGQQMLLQIMQLDQNQQVVPGSQQQVVLSQAAAQTQTQAPSAPARQQNQNRRVLVNQAALSLQLIQQLEKQYQIQIQDGAYWYDKRSGLWGIQGGPAVGVIPAGLKLGGPLQATASAGNTGIFINGRQIHMYEAAYLQQLVGVVQPGRYWLDAQGNAGKEGGPALVNLLQVARKSNSGGKAAFYRNEYTGIGAGATSDGHGYVMGKDFMVNY
ncbi:MAG: hypothetical protein ACAI44_07950 [Candidatus Sericytochromatia bacterium]